ncbi:Uma2 family endonuclease [Hymenobacter sp. BRD128]|uniref:Uma2 family endonuclease n=1 Tax=Hymenobacter sp. BRD128 TaxID=2675878 RepID=UPI001563E45C|nr:Uma2 family endonuclease [Hymenobacter sp. BRD128]QKG58022.1 Uma2 family endonuclease [Hymenobacter sp. BRD128]
MGQPATPPRHYTLKEYFALQEKSAAKYEYVEGEAFAVGGASLAHNLIKGNLVAALRPPVRRQGGRVLDESVLLVVRANAFYTYPDVLVTLDPADRRDPYLVRHPLLLAEILSSATAEYDRTEKFANYQKLPSLRHYLLISQSAWVVEWFRRDAAGQWVYTLLSTPDDVLEIPDLGLSLPLRELYDDTDVAPRRVLPGLE